MSVDVPAGIDDGQRIRITGRGHAGEHGGPAGDLYVQIRVREDPPLRPQPGRPGHRRRRRRAAGGARARPCRCRRSTATTELEIPAGTQPNETLTIRGQGMPALRGRRHGDLRVVVNVVVPRHLKREQRELLEQLSESLTEHNLRTDEGVLRQAQARLRRLIRAAPSGRPRPRSRPSWCSPSCSSWRRAGWRRSDLAGDVIEYAVYGAPGELPDAARPARRPPAARWSRSAPRRSPTTGPSAGAAFTARWCSATG